VGAKVASRSAVRASKKSQSVHSPMATVNRWVRRWRQVVVVLSPRETILEPVGVGTTRGCVGTEQRRRVVGRRVLGIHDLEGLEGFSRRQRFVERSEHDQVDRWREVSF